MSVVLRARAESCYAGMLFHDELAQQWKNKAAAYYGVTT